MKQLGSKFVQKGALAVIKFVNMWNQSSKERIPIRFKNFIQTSQPGCEPGTTESDNFYAMPRSQNPKPTSGLVETNSG